MAFSLKQEIETWVQALAHYDNNEFEESLRVFNQIADTSKILFNCGVIHATIGEHERAVECYQRATSLDQWLAVAYFQQGVSNFLVGDFEEALANFNDTLYYLRGNTHIDYEQLGLKFRLYSCEVVFNRGLCYMYLQQEKPGLQDLLYAQKEKMAPDHDVIDDAIRERAMGYTVFSIPVGVLYRPNEAKVKNLKAKDYLGRARLIATSNTQNVSTGFQGAERKQAEQIEIKGRDDRPPENISYAATNLVQRNLTTRGGREQSAPASMGRNPFPPTPPPEAEKPSKRSSDGSQNNLIPLRSSSIKSSPSRRPSNNDEREPMAPKMLSRAATIDVPRIGKPPPGPYRETSWHAPDVERPVVASPMSDRPRIGTSRTASDPSIQTRKNYHERSATQKAPLFGETTPARNQDSAPDSVEDVYRMYSNSRRQPQHSQQRRKPGDNHFDEEDEYIEEEEMNEDEIGNYAPIRSGTPRDRPSSRRPEMRKVRVKVHVNDDTRYIMFGAVVEFAEFETRIREKFGIRSTMKMKIQDDGDMITMGDQDDLEMILQNVRTTAKQERSEMGKMEVWITY